MIDQRPIDIKGELVALSPDGRWIAGTDEDDAFCVWAVETLESTCEGEELRIRQETISWAPDSSAVAFTLKAIEFLIDSDLYVFEIEDETLRNLTDDGREGDVLREQPDEAVPIDDVPAWSPDSTELVFARTSWGSEERTTTLMRIARAGGDPKPVASLRATAPFQIYTPMTWLDDDRLLYSVIGQDLENDQNGVWIVGIDGSNSRQIIPGSATADVPAPWIVDVAPDGRTVSILSQTRWTQFARKEDIFFLLDLETEELAPVRTGEPGAQIVTPPRFSPDGSALIYAMSGESEDADEVVLLDIATANQTVLEEGIVLGGAASTFAILIRGIDWADSNTLLLSGTLLMLEPA